MLVCFSGRVWAEKGNDANLHRHHNESVPDTPQSTPRLKPRLVVGGGQAARPM